MRYPTPQNVNLNDKYSIQPVATPPAEPAMPPSTPSLDATQVRETLHRIEGVLERVASKLDQLLTLSGEANRVNRDRPWENNPDY